jgi:hypothetical protein
MRPVLPMSECWSPSLIEASGTRSSFFTIHKEIGNAIHDVDDP